jgi:hypothetical protein
MRSSGRAAIAVGVAAIGCTAPVAASQLGGSPGQAQSGAARAVLTATMVRHVARASQSALARSGRAEITYQHTPNGTLQSSGTNDIAFDGSNWNFATHQTLPASGGQPAITQYATNRIVNGEAYYYTAATPARLHWYHDTNPDAVHGLNIPDPRTLLKVLKPSCRAPFMPGR